MVEFTLKNGKKIKFNVKKKPKLVKPIKGKENPPKIPIAKRNKEIKKYRPVKQLKMIRSGLTSRATKAKGNEYVKKVLKKKRKINKKEAYKPKLPVVKERVFKVKKK